MICSKNIFKRCILSFTQVLKCCNSHRVVHPTKSLFLRHSMVRAISSNVTLCTKIYVEGENRYGYSVLKASGDYKLASEITSTNTSLTENELNEMLKNQWAQTSPDELARSFSVMSDFAMEKQIDISSTIFDNFIDALTDNMDLMTDEQIEILINDMTKWRETENVTTRNFIELWVALDDTLKRRLQEWDFDKALLFSDYMYKLNLSKKAKYTSDAIKRISRKAKLLNPRQLAQTMFYICTSRYTPYDMMDLELRFEQLFENFSLEEIGLICIGFFKSKSIIRNEHLINRIMEMVILNAENCNEITLCSILKELRLSSRHNNGSMMLKMLDAITPQIDRLSMATIVQIAIIGVPIHISHPKSLSRVAERFYKSSSTARIKDIERLSLAFSLFNYVPNNNLYDLMIQEIQKPEREDEIKKYNKSIYITLSNLAVFNIYPTDLINKIFDKDYLKKVYPALPVYLPRSKNNYGREVLVLNSSLEVDCPDYTGNRLDFKVAKRLTNLFTDYMPDDSGKYNLNTVEKSILDIVKTLQKIRNGSSYVHGDHVLPHYQRPDIIVANDKDGNPVKVKKYFETGYGTVQRVKNSDYTWYAIIVTGKYAFTANTSENLGTFNMKVRQLRKIGYIPILIKITDWNILKNENEKEIYAKEALTKNVLE